MTSERAHQINDLAMEQALIDHENETELTAEDAARINQAFLHSEMECRRFKLDYRRHVRNIAEGNPFYAS